MHFKSRRSQRRGCSRSVRCSGEPFAGWWRRDGRALCSELRAAPVERHPVQATCAGHRSDGRDPGGSWEAWRGWRSDTDSIGTRAPGCSARHASIYQTWVTSYMLRTFGLRRPSWSLNSDWSLRQNVLTLARCPSWWGMCSCRTSRTCHNDADPCFLKITHQNIDVSCI